MSDNILLSLQAVEKQYEGHKAVQGVSFDVPKGSIYGILGPNGAGKTSTIRMITCITRADGGQILFGGEPLQPKHVAQIGYMPEERGLYKKMKVEEQVLYLAQLKGMSYKAAKTEWDAWCVRFDIDSWRQKNVEDLSKGMQQKVQFITTVLHRPSLLILDEPFSGLDPVNSLLIQDEIDRLHREGTTILFSTHRMEQVEQICEHIVLINKGKDVLKGEVKSIKNQYKEHLFELHYAASAALTAEQLAALPVQRVVSHDEGRRELKLQLREGENARHLLGELLKIEDLDIVLFRELLPTFSEIFIRAVGG